MLPPLRERRENISHPAAFGLLDGRLERKRLCRRLGGSGGGVQQSRRTTLGSISGPEARTAARSIRFERKLILRALSAADDNKAQAARLLGISRRTLWYKLKRYEL